VVKLSPRFKFVIIVVVVIVVIIIIIIIILVISSMQGIYNYIPETNYVSWVYTVAYVMICIYNLCYMSSSFTTEIYFVL